jgi:predicted patatin/cPLA2 family phospholipase
MLKLGKRISKENSFRIDDLIRARSAMPGYEKIWRVVGIKPVCGVAHVIMRSESHLEFKMLSTDAVRRNFEHVA